MGAILLVRHGQASFGAADYDQLSPLGERQSRILGEWLKRCGIAVDASTRGALRRHAQTASACLGAMGLAAETDAVDPGFDEYDHREMLIRHEPAFADPQAIGELLQTHAEPRKAFQRLFTEAFSRWMSGRHDDEYSESWPRFRDRCLAALQRVAEGAGKSSTTIVFTSGGPITAITHTLLGTDPKRIGELNSSIINTSVTRLLHQPGRISLSTLNHVCHLEAAGDPELITYR